MGKEYTIMKKKEFKLKMKSKAKERKQLLKEKRARLIVKNLSFAVTEEKLKTHFEQFGKVTSVQLLKKENGRLIGCGFVQFDAVQKAAKARHHLNGKPFLGRDIQCDFVLCKNKFEKKVRKENRERLAAEEKIKEEPVDVEDIEIKDEIIDIDDVVPKEEAEDESNDVQLQNIEIKQEDSKSESDEEMSEEEDNEDSGVENEEKVKCEIVDKKVRFESHDVNEGKTIFIKNLPFEATKEDLKECMKQFGRTYYALVCMDKVTEHSKGTGFVKFCNKEDADKCLQAGTELKLFDTILDCHAAVDRKQMESQALEKKQSIKKDSRNLYLVKEGVVLAGTKAAEGVSARDMAMRLQFEQFKTQMLRNLNMFVSKTRLIIHNLPPSWDDSKLRLLVKKHSGKGAVIKESRIMRNLMQVDGKGVGKSKEFGFVSFTTHDDALRTLRSLNNNPKVFTESKRPIVAFSIENQAMINTRMKRLEKSRQLNPLSKDFDRTLQAECLEKRKEKMNTQEKTKKKETNGAREKINEKSSKQQFVGTESKPGANIKMRSKHNLKTQAQTHREQLKAEHKRKKNAQKTLAERKEDFLRQDQQKINKKKERNQIMDDAFTKIVNKYKSKLLKSNVCLNGRSDNLQRGKWTEG